jgi:hypothetical protein
MAFGALQIRAWEPRDREAVAGLLGHLSRDAVVSGDHAPVYVAVVKERVVGMVTLCVFRTLTGPASSGRFFRFSLKNRLHAARVRRGLCR